MASDGASSRPSPSISGSSTAGGLAIGSATRFAGVGSAPNPCHAARLSAPAERDGGSEDGGDPEAHVNVIVCRATRA